MNFRKLSQTHGSDSEVGVAHRRFVKKKIPDILNHSRSVDTTSPVEKNASEQVETLPGSNLLDLRRLRSKP